MTVSLHTRMSVMRETEGPQKNKRKNKEQLDSSGIREGDGAQDVAHLEEMKRNNRH